jgi:phosphoglycolate phosphatase
MVDIICKDLKFPNIQAVLFDKDGTLENSQILLRELAIKRVRLIDAQIPGIGEPLLMAFGIINNQLDSTGLMAVGSREENEIAAAAYIAETGRSWYESKKIADNAFREAAKYLEKNAISSPLFSGSWEFIKYIAESGCKLGILSTDSTVAVDTFVKNHQLSPYIELTMGAEAGIKPDPALFVKACQTLGVDPSTALMVGDSQGDMEMAKKAGAAGAIAICWENLERASRLGGDIAIANLKEIQIITT